MAEALYRKYRPQVFEDVVGQEPIERTLKNAIGQDKVSHAYLFCGPRGTGKTTTARLLAKALLCENGPTPEPDGSCEDCRLIADGVHPDVYELDAASRTGVDNVREEIISRVQFAPTRGRYKVYIVDEVHMLSTAAFNALLKTLEEPPSHVVFILCTTDPQKVPETIHSRCQRFDFRRIAPESMVTRLGAICMAEGVEFEGEALDLIAHRAEGGLRNALTSLEQIIAFEGGKVTLAGAERLLGSIDSNDMAEIMAYVGRRDIANCFRWTAVYVETGADLAQFVRDMAEHVRNLYVMSLAGDEVPLDVSETARRELAGELSWFGPDRLARLLGVLGDLSAELKTSSNPRLSFEIALTRMVRPDSELTIESLAERVEALESGYSAVAHVLPGPVFDARAREAASQVAYAPEFLGSAAEPQAPAAAPSAVAHPAGETAQPAPAAAQPADEAVPDSAPAAQPGPVSDDAGRRVAAEARPDQVGRVADPVPAAAMASVPTAAASSRMVQALSNPAALQRMWQSALTVLKKQKASYGVLFLNTKVTYDESASRLDIAFPAENAFTYKTVQKPDVQDALASALAAALGEPVSFVCHQVDQPVSSAAPGAVTDVAPVAGHSEHEVAYASQPDPAHAVKTEPAAARTGAPEPRVVPRPDCELAPEPRVVPRPDCELAPAPAPVPAPAAPEFDYAYEQVPYDDEYVPYTDDDFDDPYAIDPYDGTSFGAPSFGQPQGALRDEPSEPAPAFEPVGEPAPALELVREPVETSTAATPFAPNETPDGIAPADNADDIEAMLQAGFGGGVVFEEIE